ncbi:BlaI/MecI/CopY family transcriptional regulator [Streptomyces xiaopingdaonensis]|uniref:BlaI/MecI/CopY family transcriptional regulator n=1 Tax=Streptomyces xiaopingdaonensis TaxID=1565415 RepID=UPI000362BA4C
MMPGGGFVAAACRAVDAPEGPTVRWEMTERPDEFPRGGKKRRQGELEAQVLSALRSSPEPATAAWVQRWLGGDLAHTTVVTILTRLHAKQTVTRHRSGRSYVWSPAADDAGLAALRMRRVLDSESDRSAVLTSFVSSLSPEDERLMRELLHEASAGPEEVERSEAADRRGAEGTGSGRGARAFGSEP